jgi:hypothetical protein
MPTEITSEFDRPPGRSGIKPNPELRSSAPGLSAKPVFAIGDVHGHYDRLRALLVTAGIINEAGERIRDDVTVVQVGDLGHFGGSSGSPGGDYLCWQTAYTDDWLDIILWGNHDRAVLDAQHAFKGYEHPRAEVKHFMRALEQRKVVRWAYSAHGHLFTHAGLHYAFGNNHVPIDDSNPDDVAQWLNGALTSDTDVDRNAVRNAIGRRRGGGSRAGGILWRDIEEKLFDKFPQVFGHSADHKKQALRYCWATGHTRRLDAVPDHAKDISYCIDIGGKSSAYGDPGNAIMGIWIPSGDTVRVNL